jgi:type IV secretion system protein VirD4
MVFQTPSQLREVYGVENAKTMMKSLGARIVYAPKDYDDAKEISDELGFTTVRVRSRSRPQFSAFATKPDRSANVTVSEQKRALLLPQEVKELGRDKEIIFCEGLRPILARKIRYFADTRFHSRLLPPPVNPAPRFIDTVAVDLSGRTNADTDSLLHAGEIPAQQDSTSRSVHAKERGVPTLEDIEQLDGLTLQDFAADFSRVELPSHDGPWSEQEMKVAVHTFLETLEGR